MNASGEPAIYPATPATRLWFITPHAVARRMYAPSLPLAAHGKPRYRMVIVPRSASSSAARVGCLKFLTMPCHGSETNANHAPDHSVQRLAAFQKTRDTHAQSAMKKKDSQPLTCSPNPSARAA